MVAIGATITGLALSGVVATPALAATSQAAEAAAASAPAPESTPTHDAAPAKLAAQLSAGARAKATGRPVRVDALTTETLAVTANPDGTLTMTSNEHPVRVQKNGSWVPITTTLARNSDGTFSPIASALPLAFSGGGTAPLVTVTDPGSPSSAPRTLSLSWPTPLPKPVVSGGTALYPQVFPGVDLRMAATADSYTEVLIVHDAAAAADPALRTLHLTATGTGLTMKQAAQGRLDVVDQAGSTVFTGGAPRMWDSTSDGRKGPAPTPDNPGSGIVRPLATTVGEGARRADIALVPPTDALAGTGEKFPLYLDPGLTWQQNVWVTVADSGGHWLNGSDSGHVEVGYCGYSDCHLTADFRTYFQMNTTPLDGGTSNGTHANVQAATLGITQIWNGNNGCAADPVDLYSAGPISGSTTYPGPESNYLSQASSGAGNGCPAAAVSLDARAFMQTTADNWWSNATVELRDDPNHPSVWKQFDDNPVLSVTYFYPPSAATNLYVGSGVSCNGTTYVSTLTPQLTAIARDNNSPPLNVNLNFSINGHTGSAKNTPSGNVGAWQVPAGALSADHSYTFSVAVDNGHLSAPSTTTSGTFTVLATPPTTPTITSFDYPPDYWGQPSQTGGTFTASSPDPNLQGFIYTLTGPGTERAADSSACATKRVQNFNSSTQLTDGFAPIRGGSAAIAIPPGLSVGYHTLNVEAVNYANMPSHESATYAFYVAPDITQPSANLALHQPVTVSSTVNSSWPASNLTDGNYQAAGTDNGWSSAPHTAAANTEWAQVDLGATKPVDDVDLYPRDDTPDVTGSGFPSAFTIATSTDGTTWTTRDSGPGDFPRPGDGPRHFAFTPTSARYVRVTATNLTTDTYGTYYLQLKQIAVYSGVISGTYEAAGTDLVSASVTGANGDSPYILTQLGTYSSLSDGAQTFFVGNQLGDVYTLNLTVPTAGYYALGANMTRATNYGQVSYTIDGNALTANGAPSFDGYRSSCCDSAYVVLGGAYLTAGQHSLAMTVTGKNAGSTGYNAAVDYLTVAPVRQSSFANFSAAMNNSGIATDNKPSSASFDLGTGNNALSSGALAAAGLSATAPDPINGYAFQLTAPNGGNDNVIALGQTIPNPVPSVPTKSVALLAAATCGSVSGGYVTITYTDGTDRQDGLGTVPDWSSSPPAGINPALTLTAYDKGASATPTTRDTYLYTVALPTDGTKTIASITLPSHTTTMIPGSCSTALHVLAIGTRPADTATVGGSAANWVGVWAAPADTTTGSSSSPAFSAKTLREIVHPTNTSLGAAAGPEIRIRLTDPEGASPVQFGAVTLAAQAAGTGPGTLGATAPTALTFNNSASVTLAPGTEVYSDPVALPSTAGGSGNLVVSLSIPGTATIAPVHSDATTYGGGPATYVASGNATGDTAGSPTTWSSTGTATDWLYVEDADVTTTDTTQGTVVVLGDQTSLGSGADGHTWVDTLPSALGDLKQSPGGIVNLSTAGATTAGALANLLNTVQDEPNVRSVIIDLGTNDLLAGTDYPTLENRFRQLILPLSSLGIKVYLTSIAPDPANPFTSAQEQIRVPTDNDITAPSNWNYKGYIDFDSVVTGGTRGNSGNPTSPTLLTGGAPNAAYYQDLANAAGVPTMATGVGSL
ncbi:discoidin domain-containing protein [Catenulispora sp. GAS73]|uniref:discoidin domain-containing protein n=1 Tax=Catenulispora sp. GAS73 TaxID=3156269 RepID=UPI0035130481